LTNVIVSLVCGSRPSSNSGCGSVAEAAGWLMYVYGNAARRGAGERGLSRPVLPRYDSAQESVLEFGASRVRVGRGGDGAGAGDEGEFADARPGRARRSDRTQFVQIYAPLIYGYGRKRGLQQADAADVTQ